MGKNKKKQDAKDMEQMTAEQEMRGNVEEVNENEAQNTPEETAAEAQAAAEEELANMKEKYLRLLADFENYKKRAIRERADTIKRAAQDTMSVILPVLDDFDRAKKNSDDPNTEEQLSEGIELLYHKLYSVLATKGLRPMESTGKPFDPELHEAISELPAPNDDMKGTVFDTVEKGYRLNDIIIRHAKVVVAK